MHSETRSKIYDLIKILLITYSQWIIIYFIDRKRMKNKILISDKEIEETVNLIQTFYKDLNINKWNLKTQ
jgi:hypothetical protein